MTQQPKETCQSTCRGPKCETFAFANTYKKTGRLKIFLRKLQIINYPCLVIVTITSQRAFIKDFAKGQYSVDLKTKL